MRSTKWTMAPDCPLRPMAGVGLDADFVRTLVRHR